MYRLYGRNSDWARYRDGGARGGEREARARWPLSSAHGTRCFGSPFRSLPFFMKRDLVATRFSRVSFGVTDSRS
eukprot:1397149-Prymnesium_polylepis.1